MFKHILLATDGSEASARAARVAVDLALTHGARLTALYVIDPYPYLGIGSTNPLGFQAYMSAAQEHAAQAHAAVAALADAAGRKPPLQVLCMQDMAAAQGIVQTAKDQAADLLVVGSHGRSGIGRLMLGSIAATVVAHAPVPVLVVPAHDADA